MKMTSKRIYVGGLFTEVKQDDLNTLFGKFGQVEDVEIKQRTDNGSGDFVFAFVNLNITDSSLTKCFRQLNGSSWKGRRLKLELAKESFLSRLKKEREAAGQKRTGGHRDVVAPDRQLQRPAEPAPKQLSVEQRVMEQVLASKRRRRAGSTPDDSEAPAESGRVVDFTGGVEADSIGGVVEAAGSADKGGAVKNAGDESDDCDSIVAPESRGGLNMFAGIGMPAATDVIPVAATARGSASPAAAASSVGADADGGDFLSRLESFSSMWCDDTPNSDPTPTAAPTADGVRIGSTDSGARPSVRRSDVGAGQRRDPDLDNRRRMDSVRQMRDNLEQRKRTLQMALSATDSARPNKRIVFDAGADDTLGQQVVGGASSSTEHAAVDAGRLPDVCPESDRPPDAEGADEADGGGKKLFDSSEDSSDSDVAEDADDFRVRPQFQGSEGKKLHALQMRLAGDTRFTVDERFTASGEPPRPAGEVGELEQERREQMDILSSVLGREVTPAKSTGPSDLSLVRFDPTLEEHTAKYEVKPDCSVKTKRTAQDAVEPIVSKESFYEVSQPLSALFGAKMASGEDEGFSLLRMMGRSQSVADSKIKDTTYSSTSIDAKKRKRSSLEACDSSSGSDSEVDDVAQEVQKPQTTTSDGAPWGQTQSFFLSPADRRIQEGVEFLRCTPSEQELVELSEERRPQLVELFRTQRSRSRRAVKQASARPRGSAGRYGAQ